MQGIVSIPGSMGLLPVERPCDIETGEFSTRASLVYHYGHNSPGPNIKLYNTIVSAMVDMFKKRCDAIPKGEKYIIILYYTYVHVIRMIMINFILTAKTGGCVINTCGWVDGGGYKSLLHAAKTFEGNPAGLCYKHPCMGLVKGF